MSLETFERTVEDLHPNLRKDNQRNPQSHDYECQHNGAYTEFEGQHKMWAHLLQNQGWNYCTRPLRCAKSPWSSSLALKVHNECQFAIVVSCRMWGGSKHNIFLSHPEYEENIH
jgi:hypothetical protein